MYALFSIDNEYYQPNNNLVIVFKYKEDLHVRSISNAILEFQTAGCTEEQAEEILVGREVRVGNCDFRLERLKISQVYKND